jgi:hypothetical protein
MAPRTRPAFGAFTGFHCEVWRVATVLGDGSGVGMVSRDARAARAAGLDWLRSIAVGTISAALLATSAAPSRAATRADALIAALALEQGRRCVVTRAEEPGGAPHVTVLGDACDGRGFIRVILALLTSTDAKAAPLDLDLDIGVKTLDGFNGETLRDVTLLLSVRRSAIAAFRLAAKLGDRNISGGMGATADDRATIRFEADDAGAFLRWAGLYRGMRGGALNIAMYVPGADGAVDDGVAYLRAFAIVGDPTLRPLDRLLLGPRHGAHTQFAVARLRIAFKSQSGRVTFSEGLLTGEPIAATLAGNFDLAQGRLDLRGIVFPTFQVSPMSPIFFPASWGLFGSDYAISGPPSAPVLRIDPLRTLEPGFLRKVFEFTPRDKSLAP